MKALTIRQPWASLIALGVKHIETRSWRAPQSLIGQTIAIHAGAHRPPEGEHGRYAVRTLGAVGMYDTTNGHTWAPLPLGVVVATATLAACVPMVASANDVGNEDPCLEVSDELWLWKAGEADEYADTDVTDQLPYGDFRPGRWAWMLTDAQPCEPIPAKGKQGLWEWQP